MHTHLSFLSLLQRRARSSIAHPIRRIGQSFPDYHQREWLFLDGYLTHVEIPVLDIEESVEVDVDEVAGRYFYFSPSRRNQRVSRPLSEISLYRVAIDRWLDDLTKVVGIRPIHQSRHRQRIEHHLWHLGDLRFEDSRRSCPIFVLLRPHLVAMEALSAVLADPLWPDTGLILVDDAEGMSLPGPHAVRGLSELVWVNENDEIEFDHRTLERLLNPSSSGEEPEQFLKEGKVKLPHFDEPREVSHAQFKIIKAMWGDDSRPPPEMSWSEVNIQFNIGYQSFDNAFNGPDSRGEFIEKIRRGCYQLRRKTINKTINGTTNRP
jgi:hypothetical protein